MRKRTRVGIVGAGITGLVLGRGLRARGIDCDLFEAAPRPGGVIHSLRVEGRVLEMGPQRTRLVASVERLVGALGLEDRLLRARPDLPLFVHHDGRLRRVPTGPRELLATDLLSRRGKLRLLLEPFTGPLRPGETVEDFVARKLGREAYERLVGPLYGGIYGSDPGRMPADRTLGRALETAGLAGRSLTVGILRWMARGGPRPPAVSFRDGMEELTGALYRGLGDAVHLSTPVRTLRPVRPGKDVTKGEDAVHWSLVVEGGKSGRREVLAEEVVLTCPADAAARILKEAMPEASGRLARLRYNPLAVVHLHAKTSLEGYGYQVAMGEGLATRGVTWNESLFGREGVHTAYLGGAGRKGLVVAPDGELARLARTEFRRVTGYEARALRVGRTRMPAWDASWSALEGLELPAGLHLCANYVSRAGIPGRLEAAGALAARLAAARSGRSEGERPVAGRSGGSRRGMAAEGEREEAGADQGSSRPSISSRSSRT